MERVRWWRKRFGRRRMAPLDVARTDLVVVVSSFDDVEACSRALERAEQADPPWLAEAEAVLRHHLRVPPAAAASAAEIAAQDGYSVAPEGAPTGEQRLWAGDPEMVSLTLQRVQVLDALHCSQERSRMAGLAQRAGGQALGWDALQPAPSSAASY